MLIVEDEEAQRNVLALWLRKQGYEGYLAADGQEALELLERHNIRVVISDLNMPEVDGIELCRSIRKLHRERPIYIIIITGLEPGFNLDKLMEVGADDFVAKPLNLQFLSAKLRWANRFVQLENRIVEERDRFRGLYKQMESDLAAAADLQRELMPADRRYEGFNVRSSFIPATIISGDCQNHFPLPDGRILAYQADIAGHSFRAALLSTTLQRMLTPSFCCWRDGTVLKTVQITERLNERLQSTTNSPEYFTLFLAIMDPQTGAVSFCQAGHPPAALRRADGEVAWVGDGGFPVGIFPTADFEEGKCQLLPGDELMIISDGVIECENRTGERLGRDRVETFLRERPAKELRGRQDEDELLCWLRGWHGSDDFPDDVSILTIARDR